MNYIDEIFLRANLQSLCGFLQYGVDGEGDPRPYAERINGANDAIAARIRQAVPGEPAGDAVLSEVYQYGGTLSDVYMELGVQAGILLAAQLGRNLLDVLERARQAAT